MSGNAGARVRSCSVTSLLPGLVCPKSHFRSAGVPVSFYAAQPRTFCTKPFWRSDVSTAGLNWNNWSDGVTQASHYRKISLRPQTPKVDVPQGEIHFLAVREELQRSYYNISLHSQLGSPLTDSWSFLIIKIKKVKKEVLGVNPSTGPGSVGLRSISPHTTLLRLKDVCFQNRFKKFFEFSVPSL